MRVIARDFESVFAPFCVRLFACVFACEIGPEGEPLNKSIHEFVKRVDSIASHDSSRDMSSRRSRRSNLQPHYGPKQPDVPASNLSLSHELGSE